LRESLWTCNVFGDSPESQPQSFTAQPNELDKT
jgi:hypothetical protein